jgi:hypothetical protein
LEHFLLKKWVRNWRAFHLLHFLLENPGLFIVSAQQDRKFTLGAGKTIQGQRLPLHEAGQGSILVTQFLKKVRRSLLFYSYHSIP